MAYASNTTAADIDEKGAGGLKSAGKMRRAIDSSRERKRQYTRLWDIALWYLAPEHTEQHDPSLTVITGATNRVTTHSRNRLHTNQMLPIYRTTLDLLQSVFPSLTVAPTAPSHDAIRKALANRQVARAWWLQNNMERQLQSVAQWLSPTGNAFLHNYFDPGKKKVCCEVVNPYDVVYERGARTPEESRFVAMRRRHDKEELLEAYPDHEEYIENLARNNNNEEERDTRNVTHVENRIVCWYVYYNDGEMRVLCGKKWLWKGKLPKGVEPVHLIRFLPVQQSLWGVSQLHPIIDPQAAYNEFHNLTIDIARMTSNPVWVVPRQAMVDPASLSNAPGAVVWYNGHAQQPSRAPGVSVPPHLFELQGRSVAEMQDIAGVHSTSMGKRAVGVVSRVAMDALKNRDTNQLTPVRNEMEWAVCRSARTAMLLWKHHIPEQTHVRMFDGFGQVTYAALRGTDLLDTPQVYMEPGSLFKEAQRERDATLMDLYQNKIIGPEIVKEQLSLRVGDRDAMKKMLYEDQAQAALDAVRAGQHVTFWQSPAIPTIVEVFEDFLATPEAYRPMLEFRKRVEMGDATAEEFMLKEQELLNYMRDIVVCLKAPPGADPNALAQQMNSPLFPRAAPPDKGGIELANAPQSMGAAMQAGQQGSAIDNIKQNVQQAHGMHDALKGTPGITGGLG
jgi:hypothetical protein